MSFIGKLFGTEKALEGVVDGVSKGLDKLIYTGEEKAEDRAKAVTEARQMLVDWMANTQGQNLSRRLLALSCAFVYLSQIVIAQIVSIILIFVDNVGLVTKTSMGDVVAVLNTGAERMESLVMLVFAFYFAAPHMSGIAQAVVGKFKDKVNRNG